MGWIAVFVHGGMEAVNQAFDECTQQNGGKLVGNPTVQKDLTAMPLEDGGVVSVVTVVILEDEADPGGPSGRGYTGSRCTERIARTSAANPAHSQRYAEAGPLP